MADVQRISVAEARRKVKANEALLVCGYDDAEKYKKLNLEGSISFSSFQSRLSTLVEKQGNHLLLRLTRRGNRCRSGSEVPGAGLQQRQGPQGRRRGLDGGGLSDGRLRGFAAVSA